MEREAENIRKPLGFANMVCDGGNGIVLNHELVSLEPRLFYTRYLFPCSLPAVLIISKRLFLKTPSASSNNGINFPRINVSSAARARK